jgi:hypothetical protein
MLSQKDYSILYMQQTVTYTRLYIASSVYYWQCRCHRQQARDLSVQLDAWILVQVDYWRWMTAQLITYAYTQTCVSPHGYDYWCLFIILYRWKTMNNSWWIQVLRVTSIIHVFCYPFRHLSLERYKLTWPSVRPSARGLSG